MRKLWILTLVLALLLATGCASQTGIPSAKDMPSSASTEATATPATETSTAPTTEATAAAPDFANKEVNLANVEAALTGFFAVGEYIGTDVENSGGTVYVTITYKPLSVQNENDFAVQVGHQAARVMQVLFSNAAVDVVTFKGNSATTENAIEISMSKDTAQTVDWNALIKQSQTDYKAVLNAADSHHLDSSISDKLK